MQKRADSTYTIGRTSLVTDVPTREKLKTAAKAAGMPLTEYLRVIADKETKDLQAGFGIPSKRDDMESLKQEVSRLGTAWSTTNEKIEKVVKYLADREPEQVALFKILAYGEEKPAYTPEMLKADISEAVAKVIEKMTEKQYESGDEKQPV